MISAFFFAEMVFSSFHELLNHELYEEMTAFFHQDPLYGDKFNVVA